MAKHVPKRMCIACRSMKPKAELMRLVMSDGNLTVDARGKMPGRGTYICRSAACVELALKTHRLEQQFKMPLSAGAADRLRAQAEAAARGAGRSRRGSCGCGQISHPAVPVPDGSGGTVRVVRRVRRAFGR